MEREKIAIAIISVGVAAFAVGLILGGVFSRPAREAAIAEIEAIRAECDAVVAEAEQEVADMTQAFATANRKRADAAADAKSCRQQMEHTISLYAQLRANNTRTVKSETKPKPKPKPKPRPVRQVDPSISKAVQSLLSEGLVYSVNVEFNEARIDPVIWSALDIEAKQNTVNLFSTYFEQAGSSGRVTIRSNRNDNKLATFGVWGGVKILR